MKTVHEFGTAPGPSVPIGAVEPEEMVMDEHRAMANL